MGTQGNKPVPKERGGTRIPCDIAVTVTSLNPHEPFSEPCQIILANLHGCAARSPRPIGIGTTVDLRGLPGNHTASAHVVNCFSLGKFERLWILGLALEEPGNVWGVEDVPEDWDERKNGERWGDDRKKQHLRKQA